MAPRRAPDFFRPRSVVLPSEWAGRERLVPDGDLKGSRWSWAPTPFVPEIVDFATRPWAGLGVVMKSTRTGYTEGVIGTAGGLLVWTEDPCQLAIVQPNDADAKSYAISKLDRMIRHTPAMDALVPGRRADQTRDRLRSDQTTLYRQFPGGELRIIGTKDGALRGFGALRVLVDELDEAEKHGSVEGDVVTRLRRRTDDYLSGVVLAGSSPRGQEETSAIWKLWLKSDQRLWMMPCPRCGHRQDLVFERLWWPKVVTCCGTEGEYREPCGRCGLVAATGSTTEHLTAEAGYRCAGCDALLSEREKPALVQAGRWTPTAKSDYPGWHMTTLISLLGRASWAQVAAEFRMAHTARNRTEAMTTFTNTVLGLPVRAKRAAERLNLLARQENYGRTREGAPVEVPPGVGILTAGVDVHKRWSEILVRGWGLSGESWDIAHQKLHLRVTDPRLWEDVEAFLARGWRAPGRVLPVSLALVDSGDFAKIVYDFVRGREPGVMASKGIASAGAPLARRAKTPNDFGIHLVTVGTMTGKPDFFARLDIPLPGPDYIHLRAPVRELCNGFGADYVKQLTSERPVVVENKFGHEKIHWAKQGRNEALDLHVLATAAWALMAPRVEASMPRYVAAASQTPPPTENGRLRRPGIRVIHKGY